MGIADGGELGGMFLQDAGDDGFRDPFERAGDLGGEIRMEGLEKSLDALADLEGVRAIGEHVFDKSGKDLISQSPSLGFCMLRGIEFLDAHGDFRWIECMIGGGSGSEAVGFPEKGAVCGRNRVIVIMAVHFSGSGGENDDAGKTGNAG